jgi:hypothetical protein
MNQKAYLESMATRFHLVDAKPAYIPMEPGANYSADQSPAIPINMPYQEACGSVLWPAVVTHPDVAFAVGVLARFSQNPAQAHWAAIKRVMRYLHVTRDLWLTFGGDDMTAEGYSDADWASQLHRHSISGYVFRMGCGAVTWSSKKQSLVALSSTEAEYIVMTHAAKELLWLRTFLSELSGTPAGPTTLRVDNQSTITICKDNKFHARTKHIDIHYHFIRKVVSSGCIAVQYLPTEDNTADIFTKPLGRQRFEKLARQLGLRLA